DAVDRLKSEVGRIFVGPESTIELLLVTTLARGHALLEGVPGVAKTTLVRAFARTLDAEFGRIQFTPDLLPADVTGTQVFDQRDRVFEFREGPIVANGSYVPNLESNEFVLRRGPIFANVVLGDEINRAPAKTQAALLEAMQERQVTIEGRTHPLEEPFLVLATRNPVEEEGVYRLPRAQLDRFLLKIDIGYPTEDEEVKVLETHQSAPDPAEQILEGGDIRQLRELTDAVHVSEDLQRYVVRLARYTREHDRTQLGASPRAGLSLVRSSKARAVLAGRDFVLPDDIRKLAEPVLAHRIAMSPEAELGGADAADVVESAVDSVSF
ncbi:MAG: AAA family ATPase, partial [Bradymonadaceae bacterium]